MELLTPIAWVVILIAAGYLPISRHSSQIVQVQKDISGNPDGKFKSKVPDFFSCLKRRLLIKCYTSLETLFHTLFFDIIAVNFNALFQSFYPLCKTFGTFLCREVLELSLIHI